MIFKQIQNPKQLEIRTMNIFRLHILHFDCLKLWEIQIKQL